MNIKNKEYTSRELSEIGINVASLWGAEFLGVEVSKDKSVYRFDCIEHGERFYTNLSFEELEKYLL